MSNQEADRSKVGEFKYRDTKSGIHVKIKTHDNTRFIHSVLTSTDGHNWNCIPYDKWEKILRLNGSKQAPRSLRDKFNVVEYVRNLFS